jgi:hypothetical protein
VIFPDRLDIHSQKQGNLLLLPAGPKHLSNPFMQLLPNQEFLLSGIRPGKKTITLISLFPPFYHPSLLQGGYFVSQKGWNFHSY